MAKRQPANFKSDFAVLDVKAGRAALKRHIDKGGKTRVVITGEIDHIGSQDDGVSREFCLSVSKVEVIA